MRTVVLIDNVSNGPLAAEWGLSIYIEYDGHRILLDTGGSSLFAQNADALGVDLSQVEFGVLSHAHYDHSDGLDEFFRRNDHAPFYLRAGCGEDCYGTAEDGGFEYIGVRRGLLGQYPDRIRSLEGRGLPAPGVTLLPHTAPDLVRAGKKHSMFRLTQRRMVYDDFAHEQSLVFETEQGLVIFNSCCHAGADVVVREVMQAFPGRPVRAIIGGFHLYQTPPEEVRTFAKRLRETGVKHVVTGHCTGDAGFSILREELGDQVRQMASGLVLDLP